MPTCWHQRSLVIGYVYKDNLKIPLQPHQYEEQLRPTVNIGWNNNKGGICPPSKKGWKPSASTLAKRSKSLKGVVRSEEWCKNLSEGHTGEKNGMYGRKHSRETLDKKRQSMKDYWTKKKSQVV
jgi:hypothetical protein